MRVLLLDLHHFLIFDILVHVLSFLELLNLLFVNVQVARGLNLCQFSEILGALDQILKVVVELVHLVNVLHLLWLLILKHWLVLFFNLLQLLSEELSLRDRLKLILVDI